MFLGETARSLRLAALGVGAMVVAAVMPTIAGADDYPAKGSVISVLIGAGAGAGPDISARLGAAALEKEFPGVTFQPVNRVGAAHQVAFQLTADAPKDGLTLGFVTFPHHLTLYLNKDRQAKFDRSSFAPIGNFLFDPGAFGVRADGPYKTLGDLITAAKANPGKINFGVSGPFVRDHLDVLTLEKLAGVDFNEVFHQESSSMMTNLLGGNIDVFSGSVGDFLAQVQAGRVRILSVSSDHRSSYVPDVPTVQEQGYNLVSGTYRGFTFPAGVPDQMVQTLSDALGRAVQDPEFQEKVKAMGFEALYIDHDKFSALWESEEARIQKQLTEFKH